MDDINKNLKIKYYIDMFWKFYTQDPALMK